MSEKIRVFFYHFRLLYTYQKEEIFLNFDLLRMQEINRKIKNYIKKYPDIHFYIDYDNNENEKENGMNGMERNYINNEDYYMNHTYEENKKSINRLDTSKGYDNRNVNVYLDNSKKIISYDEEKEHFHHLKKNQNYDRNCKFCIKFREIHKIGNTERIMNLYDKEEKTNIKNMIYYGKTIRTNLFLHSPYEYNIYKNCKTFIDDEEFKNDDMRGLRNVHNDVDDK